MTATQVETPRIDKAQRDQRTGRLLPAAVAVAGIWLAMALSSVFAPDLISADYDHVPIVDPCAQHEPPSAMNGSLGQVPGWSSVRKKATISRMAGLWVSTPAWPLPGYRRRRPWGMRSAVCRNSSGE